MKKRVKLEPHWRIIALWWHAWELLGKGPEVLLCGYHELCFLISPLFCDPEWAYYTCLFLLHDSVSSGSCITHSLSKDECFLRLKHNSSRGSQSHPEHDQYMLQHIQSACSACVFFHLLRLPIAPFFLANGREN